MSGDGSVWGRLDRTDRRISDWMASHGIRAIQWSMAIVFIWFGALKPLGLSPANDLVTKTVYWVDPAWFVPLLGVWEVAIGVCLLVRPLIRAGIFLLALQMPGTMLPLVVLPEVCWVHAPYAPTLEGQYIIKNLVLISAAMVVGGTVRQAGVRTSGRSEPMPRMG